MSGAEGHHRILSRVSPGLTGRGDRSQLPASQAAQQFTAPDAVGGVHIKQPCRRAPDIRPANETETIEPEMVVPVVTARVEQRRDMTLVRIDAGEVGAFAEITFGTGQREVLLVILSTVLPGDDVLDVKA